MNSVATVHAEVRAGMTALPASELAEVSMHTQAAWRMLGDIGAASLNQATADALHSLGRARDQLMAVRGELAAYIAETGGTPAYDSTAVRDDPVVVEALSAQERQQHEWLMERGIDTFRGLVTLERVFREIFGLDIRELIRGKVVCDMGSGCGGLAQSAALEGIPTEIYSLNPRLAGKDIAQPNAEYAVKVMRLEYPNVTDDEIAHARRVHDTRLIARMAHDTGMPNDSFDLLVDVMAVSAYMGRMDHGARELYRRTMQEYMRVLKPGGMALIVDPGRFALGAHDPNDPRVAYREDVMRELGIPYEVIYADDRHADDEDLSVLGAILWKPRTR